jgi:hypothetical protein
MARRATGARAMKRKLLWQPVIQWHGDSGSGRRTVGRGEKGSSARQRGGKQARLVRLNGFSPPAQGKVLFARQRIDCRLLRGGVGRGDRSGLSL